MQKPAQGPLKDKLAFLQNRFKQLVDTTSLDKDTAVSVNNDWGTLAQEVQTFHDHEFVLLKLSTRNMRKVQRYIANQLIILKGKNRSKNLKIIKQGRNQLKEFLAQLEISRTDPEFSWKDWQQIEETDKYRKLQQAIVDLGYTKKEGGLWGKTGLESILPQFPVKPKTWTASLTGIFKSAPRSPGSPAPAPAPELKADPQESPSKQSSTTHLRHSY